jgi:Fe-S cluster biogenesis protein NfuA
MPDITKEQVESVLQKLRPYLQVDGGDVELVDISDDNIVKVRLLGACYSCPLNLMTLRAGIERHLMKEIPEMKRLESAV